ncbi:MerR family DNA-binding protein [Streptomyces sp. NBC_01174]|uniref:MerR family DNA-binding protein n=1 Tax=Streptomyces sp. NBC_01174 TaxID=2903758 RepID=UPI0038691A52
MYGEDAAERLAFIGTAKHLGLPLEEIGELPGVWEAGAVRTAMPEGLRLTLPVERTGRIAELAAAEQQCCPFFDFRLHLDGPHLHLEVRAPAEGAGLLSELFGPAA